VLLILGLSTPLALEQRGPPIGLDGLSFLVFMNYPVPYRAGSHGIMRWCFVIVSHDVITELLVISQMIRIGSEANRG
jgi:hypothetical protein